MATDEALGESVYSVHVNFNFPLYDLLRFLLLDSDELVGRLAAACAQMRWQDAVHLIQSGRYSKCS